MISAHYALVQERAGVPDALPPTLEDGKPNPFVGQAHRRVLVTGGTGFIGKNAVQAMLDVGHAVTILSRHPIRAARMFGGRARAIQSLDELSADDVFDCVVNLAGAPVVGRRWTRARRATLERSRIGTTNDLIAWVRRTRHRPAVWVQASAIGTYGVRPSDEVLDETSAPGSGFMSRLCLDWEAAARPATELGVRQVVLRLGVVFGHQGALPMMVMPHRLGLGARLGDGRQMISWIHLDDALGLIAHAFERESVRGVYNAVAPDPVSQEEFAQRVAKLLHRPLFLRIPAGPLRVLTGEMGELMLDGQRVMPARLTASEYPYLFPTFQQAIEDLV